MKELICSSTFDWKEVIQVINRETPPAPGKQILNFSSTDRHYSYDEKAVDFVKTHLQTAREFEIDAHLMRFASDKTTLSGYYLEMGVCTGRTINFIAALNSDKIIYGFDSFAGLPKAWEGRSDFDLPKGVFAYKDPQGLPATLHNVRLIKGLFEETLPLFKNNIIKNQPIAFIHIDCDIYDSTHAIFEHLGDNIVSGTILLFDELYNYPGFELHEYKALQEFMEKTGKAVEYFAYNVNSEQVAVKII
jgi:hypothetical protein